MKRPRIRLSTIRGFVLILAFSLLAGSTGYWWGQKHPTHIGNAANPQAPIVNTADPESRGVDFSLFWDVWSRLEHDYVDKTKVDHQKMVWGAISGMTSSLGDPYTVFLPPAQNKEAKESLNGSFEGIGAQLGGKDGKIVVVAPLKGMPAEAAGIRAGDWILKVDGEDTAKWSVPQTVEKIRGQKGSKITLTVLHEDEQQSVDISIERNIIQVPSVETEFRKNKEEEKKEKESPTVAKGPTKEPENGPIIRNGVAILKLYQFGDNTNNEWEKAVSQIISRCAGSCRGMVLDVRNNPGGYLQGAIFVASEFLKDGVVVVQEHASGMREVYQVNRKGDLLTLPLIVLVNKGSASASEIVAGALKVRGRAKIVGEQSFGKGSVQEALDLPGGAGLHITTAKWLLPDETWINEVDVTPDVVVTDDKNTADVDEQLEKAIEMLTK